MEQKLMFKVGDIISIRNGCDKYRPENLVFLGADANSTSVYKFRIRDKKDIIALDMAGGHESCMTVVGHESQSVGLDLEIKSILTLTALGLLGKVIYDRSQKKHGK